MMNSRAAILIVSLFVIAGCVSGPLSINDPYSLTVTDEERDKIIAAWFSCDECVNGQLRRVQELGDTALERLDASYNGETSKLSGSALAIEDNLLVYRARCERVDAEIMSRGLDVAANSCDRYVSRFERNLKRKYETRAEQALLAIRTPNACGVIGRDKCLNIPPFEAMEAYHSTGRSVRYPD